MIDLINPVSMGMFIGFAASILPRVIDMFSESSDRVHELRIMDKQIQMRQLGIKDEVDPVQLQYEIQAHQETRDNFLDSVKAAGRLAANVRPIVTYILLGTFIAIKFMLLWKFMFFADTSLSLKDAATWIWGDQETSFMAAILSFWFGSRDFGKRK